MNFTGEKNELKSRFIDVSYSKILKVVLRGTAA